MVGECAARRRTIDLGTAGYGGVAAYNWTVTTAKNRVKVISYQRHFATVTSTDGKGMPDSRGEAQQARPGHRESIEYEVVGPCRTRQRQAPSRHDGWGQRRNTFMVPFINSSVSARNKIYTS